MFLMITDGGSCCTTHIEEAIKLAVYHVVIVMVVLLELIIMMTMTLTMMMITDHASCSTTLSSMTRSQWKKPSSWMPTMSSSFTSVVQTPRWSGAWWRDQPSLYLKLRNG